MIAAAVLACAASLQAATITGTIAFGAVSFSPSNPDLSSPSDVITITPAPSVGGGTGDLTGATLTSFTSPITLNVGGTATFSNPLWVLLAAGGSRHFTFTASGAATEVTSLSNVNTIQGTGTVSDGVAADNANGTYIFTFNKTSAGGTVSFSWAGTSGSTTPPPSVPDGGTTVMLLGSALAGLGLIRRKLA